MCFFKSKKVFIPFRVSGMKLFNIEDSIIIICIHFSLKKYKSILDALLN